MPLSNYDSVFGGKSGSAAEAHAAMVRQYGKEKGDRVFYSTVNKRKKKKRRKGSLARQLRSPS
jgi:hypothetical protein